MRVLAIDTALEACSVAVLDTESADASVHESLPMQRGHAEALTTLTTFAAPFIAADDTLPVVVAIDARHDHVYLQVFGPGGRTLVAPRVAPVREALRVSATGAPRVTGTAAAKLAWLWPAGERPPTKVEQRGAADINWVARLGAAASDTGTPPKPLYLRPPDAHP